MSTYGNWSNYLTSDYYLCHEHMQENATEIICWKCKIYLRGRIKGSTHLSIIVNKIANMLPVQKTKIRVDCSHFHPHSLQWQKKITVKQSLQQSKCGLVHIIYLSTHTQLNSMLWGSSNFLAPTHKHPPLKLMVFILFYKGFPAMLN